MLRMLHHPDLDDLRIRSTSEYRSSFGNFPVSLKTSIATFNAIRYTSRSLCDLTLIIPPISCSTLLLSYPLTPTVFLSSTFSPTTISTPTITAIPMRIDIQGESPKAVGISPTSIPTNAASKAYGSWVRT